MRGQEWGPGAGVPETTRASLLFSFCFILRPHPIASGVLPYLIFYCSNFFWCNLDLFVLPVRPGEARCGE